MSKKFEKSVAENLSYQIYCTLAREAKQRVLSEEEFNYDEFERIKVLVRKNREKKAEEKKLVNVNINEEKKGGNKQ